MQYQYTKCGDRPTVGIVNGGRGASRVKFLISWYTWVGIPTWTYVSEWTGIRCQDAGLG